VQTMKPMGGGFLLRDKAITPAECLQYALSQPASVVIHGMDKMEYLEEAFTVVKNFQPLTQAQIEALAEKAKQAAMSGKYELYKTSAHFDSTAQHPNWLG
jgi:predicted aldo/keto reductase-like oxidoreductase